MDHFLLSLLITLSLFTSFTCAYQNYSANSALDCSSSDENGPSSAFLYTCNGQKKFCKAFLIFKTQPFYNSVPTVSSLASANQAELASINNVTRHSGFPTNKEVIVPVFCSCLGQYYQANTTFHSSNHKTYYIIASQIFEGLATCASIKRANPYGEFDLELGLELKVPLRCACPTARQIKDRVKYLLTYPITSGDNIAVIAKRFNVSEETIIDANGLEESSVIYPGTTILIPLTTKPTSSQTLVHEYPPANSPSLVSADPGSRKPKKKVYEWVGIAAACSLLCVSVLLPLLLCSCRRRVNKGSESKRVTKEVLPEDLRVEIASVEQVLKVYSLKEVKKATDNFSSRNRIKGCVHWGKFGGEILVIKKMSRDVSKEVNILKRLNHFNLIKLQGVCENLGCFYLVFEHMQNGSLREWLSGKKFLENGNWSRRIQIALDIANGLSYLHSFTEPACVHKDISSSNILLDSNLRAKISNFSLARVAATDGASTKHVEGTRGYMAPEYVRAGQISSKIDVYAFGIVLLELVTGKDAVFIQNGRETLLSTAVISIMEKENAELELGLFIDPSLTRSYYDRKLAKCLATVSLACLTKDPTRRPGMREVVSALLKIQAQIEKLEALEVESVNEPLPKWLSSIGEVSSRAEAISKY